MDLRAQHTLPGAAESRPTCVIFDVETDSLPTRETELSIHSRMRHVQVTCACALVVDVADVLAVAAGGANSGTALVESARKIVEWRDDEDGSAPYQSPFQALLRSFDSADVIVAYNGCDFDMPALHKYYGTTGAGSARYMAHRAKIHDPFVRIRSIIDNWPKLDDLLKLNDIPPKIGDGKLAIRLWEQNRRDELARYCAYDVEALLRLVVKTGPIRTPKGPVPNSAISLRAAIAAMLS